MKAPSITLAALICLTGCATTLNPEYQASLDSWVGAPVVEFLAHHREPDSMIDMVEYRVYVWDLTTSSSYTSRVATNCTKPLDLGDGILYQPVCTNNDSDTYTVTSTCAWRLQVDDNIIREATLTGDSCGEDEHPVPRSAAD